MGLSFQGLGRLRQESCRCKACLGYRATSILGDCARSCPEIKSRKRAADVAC